MKKCLALFVFLLSCSSYDVSTNKQFLGKNEDQLISEIGMPYFITDIFENSFVYGYKYDPYENYYFDASIDFTDLEYSDNLKISLFHFLEGVVVEVVILDDSIQPDMFEPKISRYLDAYKVNSE